MLLLVNYIMLIPLNPQSDGFWIEIMVFGPVLLFLILSAVIPKTGIFGKYLPYTRKEKEQDCCLFSSLLFLLAGLVLYGLVRLFCSPVFHAEDYASAVGKIGTTSFGEACPQTGSVDSIALIDTKTAAVIGARKLGFLEDVVSQFRSGAYTQITYRGKVKKTAAIDYDGFFKYMENGKTGTPGYLMVDPVDGTAELVRTKEGIRYSPGAFFSNDIRRHQRGQYRTELFGGTYFEIDEEGHPFWITQIKRNRLLLCNPVITGVIITDAVTGESVKYAVGDVPEWVDTVFDGDYICEKYDNHGRYSGGFWNSLKAKRNCRKITRIYGVGDFGYLTDGRDIWIYTGVTSATKADLSDVGMLMANERTGEVKYMSLAGADEASAMAAAEGEVSAYRYTASFPSIISVDGSPAYIMVMTDAGRIVKKYAMVNMENCSEVVAGNTKDEVLGKYRRLVGAGTPETAEPEDAAEKKYTSIIIGNDDGGQYAELVFEDGSEARFRMADPYPAEPAPEKG